MITLGLRKDGSKKKYTYNKAIGASKRTIMIFSDSVTTFRKAEQDTAVSECQTGFSGDSKMASCLVSLCVFALFVGINLAFKLRQIRAEVSDKSGAGMDGGRLGLSFLGGGEFSIMVHGSGDKVGACTYCRHSLAGVAFVPVLLDGILGDRRRQLGTRRGQLFCGQPVETVREFRHWRPYQRNPQGK